VRKKLKSRFVGEKTEIGERRSNSAFADEVSSLNCSEFRFSPWNVCPCLHPIPVGGRGQGKGDAGAISCLEQDAFYVAVFRVETLPEGAHCHGRSAGRAEKMLLTQNSDAKFEWTSFRYELIPESIFPNLKMVARLLRPAPNPMSKEIFHNNNNSESSHMFPRHPNLSSCLFVFSLLPSEWS